MKTGAAIIGFLFSCAIGGAIGYQVGAKNGTTGTVKVQPTAANTAPSKPGDAQKPAGADDVYKVPVGTSPAHGPEDALVTIVEFSDFECPFCQRVVPTIKQVEQEYAGKVRVVFKQNPLPFHQHSMPAAKYALAAHEQGKFWEMHDKLFEHRDALEPAQIEGYAKEIGIDVGKLKAYVDADKGKDIIQAEMDLANKVGARGTPAFFINGVNLSGAQPYQNFKAIIDAQIEKATKMLSSGVSKKELYAKIIESGRDAPPPPAAKPQQAPTTRQNVELTSNAPTKGGKQPLVTIVEWSDFECPFCSRAVPTVDQILKAYGDKVSVTFRHQPLPFHPRAMPSAKAAVAAGKQGKFWEFYEKAFANQKSLGDEDLEKYAKEAGVNLGKWKTDRDSPDTDAFIKKDMDDGAKYGARGTPSFFVNGVPVRGAMPFESFKAVIDKEVELAEKMMKDGVKRADLYTEIMKREAGKVVADGAGAPPSPAAPPAPTGPVDVKFGRAPVQGSPDAPIKVIMYSDFQCPFCSRVNPAIDQIKETYGSKVAIAFKNYPLPFHQNAELAAIAGLAAHKQGKFWEMHKKMFGNQQALQRDNLIGYAKELGLNVDKFTKDLDDPTMKEWVKADMDEGSKIGVNGTPATFVNGRLVSGAQPFEAFKAIIDEELKKKS